MCLEAEQCIKYQCENTDESEWRLNTGMAPTCDWMIKIVKVNNLYLNSLLVSMVNRVSRSGTMKYQCENTDESNKKWLLNGIHNEEKAESSLFSEVVQRYSGDEKVIR